MPYAAASGGFLAMSVFRHAWRPWCSGKRNSPASSILLSTKHWQHRPRRLRRPDPIGQSQRALRDRALCDKDFGVSGTLNGEWRPASDRINDFRCRPRARECRIGLCGLPPRTLRGFRDRRRTETVGPRG